MLTRKQIGEFERRGILRLPGAVPVGDAEAMCDRIWAALSRKYRLDRHDPRTWRALRLTGTHHLPKSEMFAEIGSPQIRAALDDLLGQRNWQEPQRWGSTLVAFPEGAGPWEVPRVSWHLDYPAAPTALKPFGVRIFTCLAKLESGGGGTVFVTGSHRMAQGLVDSAGVERLRSAEARNGMIRAYPWMGELCSRDDKGIRDRFMTEVTEVDGIPLQVVEMTGEPGDVLLAHPMILHAASKNCAVMPRIVLSSIVNQIGAHNGYQD